MTKEQAIEWVEIQKKANQLAATEIDGIHRNATEPNKVHVRCGVATLAAALGIPYTVEIDPSRTYAVKIMFTIDGYTFYQWEKDLKDATDVCNS